MQITIYGKKGCGKCTAAKDKMRLMGVEYTSANLADFINPTEGWRDGPHREVLAWAADQNASLGDAMPAIQINDRVYDYSGGIKEIRRILKKTT